MTDIFQIDGKNGEDRPDGKASRFLPGDTLASMNMWGFSHTIFDAMDKGFAAFLDKHGGERKSEFYITTFMDSLIQNQTEKVKVIDTDSEWFGVTYQEDKPLVVDSIARRVASGIYPSPLWAKV